MTKGYTEEDLIDDPETFKYMVHHGNNMSKIVSLAQSITEKPAPVVHVYTGLAGTGIYYFYIRKIL